MEQVKNVEFWGVKSTQQRNGASHNASWYMCVYSCFLLPLKILETKAFSEKGKFETSEPVHFKAANFVELK